MVFYGVPYGLSLEHGGKVLYFFGAHYIDSTSFSIILLGHLILGLLIVFFVFNNRLYVSVILKKNGFDDFLLVVVFVSSFVINIAIIKMILYPLYIVLYMRRKRYKVTDFILYGFCFGFMLGKEGRHPLIQTLLLTLLPSLSRASLFRLALLSVIAIWCMVYILQPLKYGFVPFSINTDIEYFFQHLQPIYIGADLSLHFQGSKTALFAESVPFLKSGADLQSVIEIISSEGLSREAFDSGVRYGSNSAMYFSGFGFLAVLLFLTLFKYITSLFKSNLLSTCFLMYFVVYGPYFIRRTIGSYFVDLFTLVFIFLVFKILIEFSVKGKKVNHVECIHFYQRR
ncbi:MAG: hypothetical protein OXB92_16790 [Acidimicrobiaceae bacterium]|nr:hypothetical protein [Acidimicrobiaceae bacterium]